MTQHVAAALLTHTPAEDRLKVISEYLAQEHFPDLQFSYNLSDTLPEDLSPELSKHLSIKKATSPGSVYLIVRPTG